MTDKPRTPWESLLFGLTKPEEKSPAPNLFNTLFRLGTPPGSSLPPVQTPAPRLSPPAKPATSPSIPHIAWARFTVNSYLRRKAELSSGRVLPTIDDLRIMEGRKVRAAFVYSDLHGFTKLIATQSTNRSFVLLQSFVHVASQVTRHYGGEVMDCAGDRILSVFHRPPANLSIEPVEDGVTFALWLQTVFRKAIAPAFGSAGFQNLSVGIGIDYGEATVGCVGVRNGKRIVFFGNAANHAAKLQELAREGETVISAEADRMRPAYLNNGHWNLQRERLTSGEVILRVADWFSADTPPKLR